MNRRILIIHGWESNSREHWFQKAKERWEKLGHKVEVPDMPNAFYPQKEKWVKVIEDFKPDQNSILIGHSLGGTTILRYLEKAKKKVGRSILIATPIRQLKADYDFGPIENFFKPNFDWRKIKQNCKEFVILNQTEDDWVPLQHGKDLVRFVGGELVIVKGDNHFDTIDFGLLEKRFFTIKTIILDLGGVYFREGTSLALPKIFKLINAPQKKILEIFTGQSRQEGFLYRRGKMTKKEFWQAAIKKLQIDPKLIPKLQEIWHSAYKPNQGMKELVLNLRKNYKVIAFSGNIRERFDYLNKKYGLRQDFDGFVLSYKVGYSKIDREFYQVLLKKIDCKREECIFVDDYQEFLDSARSLDIKTVLFENPAKLKSDLRKLGVKI